MIPKNACSSFGLVGVCALRNYTVTNSGQPIVQKDSEITAKEVLPVDFECKLDLEREGGELRRHLLLLEVVYLINYAPHHIL